MKQVTALFYLFFIGFEMILYDLYQI